MKEFISVREAAEFLDCSPSVLYRATARREIPFYKMSGAYGRRGGRIKFTVKDLKKYAERFRIEPVEKL